ncbi:MAG: hypothetical protein JJU15_13470 [Pararhodobacter sp.]|nr:hypothetical protein [Pararhodobacter sp.]
MSYQPREFIVSLLDTIATTRRPRMLLRAARIGMQDYRRESDLRRVLRLPAAPPPGPATVRDLIALEAEIEAGRTRPGHIAGDTWRAARHVEVMIALMAEAQLMAEAVPAPAADHPPAAPPPRRLTLAHRR